MGKLIYRAKGRTDKERHGRKMHNGAAETWQAKKDVEVRLKAGGKRSWSSAL
jgi:hypothetical protein